MRYSILLISGGALLLLLGRQLMAPEVPPPAEFQFQPVSRPAGRLPVDLPSADSAPVPSAAAATCAGLQRFANYEHARGYQAGRLPELLRFSGFEAQRPTVSDAGVIACSGGEYVRRNTTAERRCRNVLITYDTRTNTLSHNVQYSYMESGLVAQCSDSHPIPGPAPIADAAADLARYLP